MWTSIVPPSTGRQDPRRSGGGPTAILFPGMEHPRSDPPAPEPASRRLSTRLSRRRFLGVLGGAVAALPAPPAIIAGAGPPRIARIALQVARGRRRTPVAPNAYAPYRGFDVAEPVLRIRTASGIEGLGRLSGKAEGLGPDLRSLIGLDPAALFSWDGERIGGPAEGREALLGRLGSVDYALVDLLGKLRGKPAADLLGERRREEVPVYDSSLYMEDLLAPGESRGLAFLDGPPPGDPAEMVARKALWVLGDGRGIRILKIKIGRAKWIPDRAAALRRDIEVIRAVRRAAGKEPVLLVDGNDGYLPRPLEALELARAVAAERIHAMEEMFPEEKVGRHRQVKEGLIAAGLPAKLADGEGHRDGIPETLLAERIAAGPGGDVPGRAAPLFDIDQPDMNANGFLRILAIAAAARRHGVAMAPHNFASKMGFWAQVHAGLVLGNFEFAETDDSEFPGLAAPGIAVRRGAAELTGVPGLGISLVEERLEKPALVIEA